LHSIGHIPERTLKIKLAQHISVSVALMANKVTKIADRLSDEYRCEKIQRRNCLIRAQGVKDHLQQLLLESEPQCKSQGSDFAERSTAPVTCANETPQSRAQTVSVVMGANQAPTAFLQPIVPRRPL
jgi:hypothetical protein